MKLINGEINGAFFEGFKNRYLYFVFYEINVYGSQHYSIHGCPEMFYFIALENIKNNCTTIHLNMYLKRA